ncbi:MAG: DUF2199 domain-containing protein [Akkermansiaceae bacterium]|nr:DUF2199 domain-containing protein [Armatimonadota bacterium]
MNRGQIVEEGFHCRRCGIWHDELPTGYGAEAPLLFYQLPARDRGERVERDEETCIIRGDPDAYFIAANLEIPIIGEESPFVWTVWVSLSEASMERTLEHWETPGRENDPPCFGWLSTDLPTYPATLNLKTMVHTRPVGERPFVELEPTNHPLAVEQRDGISWDRVRQIAEAVLHDD